MTEIIIDGFACEDKPVKPRNFKEIFGNPFGDFFERIDRLHEGREETEPAPDPVINPLSPEGFDQIFHQVNEKPRVKGIAEDWFRNELRKGLERSQRMREADNYQSVASEPPSKGQHADHKADNALHRDVKKAQDFKTKKQQALGKLQKRLAQLNSKRPKDPAKVKTWTARRQALTQQILEKRESIRVSDKRIADKRVEYRGN